MAKQHRKIIPENPTVSPGSGQIRGILTLSVLFGVRWLTQSLVPSFRRSPSLRWLLLLGCVLVIGGGVVFFDWWLTVPDTIPITYVGRESCKACHETEYRLWEGSDHDLAMDHATPRTVLGDFNDCTFTHIAFSDFWRFSDEELAAIIAQVDDKTLAVALQPYEVHHSAEAFYPFIPPSGDQSRRRILDLLPVGRRPKVERLVAWQKTFTRPCEITDAHRKLGDIARDLINSGRIPLPDWAVTSRFFRRGDRYFVVTDDREGKLREFAIDYVFGVYPLQQYLVTFSDGRVQCLPVAWDVKSRRWFHLYPSDPVPAQDPLHWTRALQNWNYMCADCHTTNLQKNFDVATNTYRTAWSEIDVSCEACHGPGSLHVQLAESWSLFWDRKRGNGLVSFSPKTCDNKTVVDSCAPCHARRRPIASPFPPGEPLLDYYIPEFIDGNLYYVDGQILDEDYEYASFLQSLMYRKGVRCTDCHDPHTARVKFANRTKMGEIREPYLDNKLCGQCHLPSKYDSVQHHHHPDSSKPGTRCVECHMPETTYMVVDRRRDHSLRIPRPDLTISLGIPNACNLCHQDPDKGETPEWAVEWIRKWYAPRQEPPHFAYAFDKGRKLDFSGIAELIAVFRRQDLSAMVRASAVLLLANYGDEAARGAVFAAAQDPEPLVRLAAARALQNMRITLEDAPRIRHLLSDPIRSVRVESVPWAMNIDPQGLTGGAMKALQSAVEEYRISQQLVADQPGAHMNLALLAEAAGNIEEQEQRYLTALRIDPLFLPARNNLGMLYTRSGRFAEAEQQYRAALESNPDFVPVRDNLARLYYQMGQLENAEKEFREILARNSTRGDIHFALGLLLAEIPGRLADAIEELQEAGRLLPHEPRVLYNAAVALQKVGKVSEAVEYYEKAYRLGRPTADLLQGYALCLEELKRCAAAAAIANELYERFPSPATARFRDEILRRCQSN
ncbi:MAG: tetratricopeptide repeat protein [Thermogutta sp.]